MHVAGEMQIESFHRHYLAVPASGGAALDSQSGAHRRLADRDNRTPSGAVEALPQSHRGGCFSFAQRSGSNGTDNHIFGLGARLELVNGGEVDLGDSAAIGLE